MPDIHEPFRQACSFHLFPDLPPGQVNRLVAQPERSPVHDHDPFRAQLPERPYGFFRIDVRVLHEPAGLVRPEVEDREVDIELASDLFETVEEGQIAGDIDDRPGFRSDEIGTPQGRVRSGDRVAHGPVAARKQDDLSGSVRKGVEPVELMDGLGAVFPEKLPIACGVMNREHRPKRWIEPASRWS